MHRSIISLALFAFSSTAAVAGPYEAPPAPPPVYVEEERCTQSFDCFYVGLEYGHIQSELSQIGGAVTPFGDYGLDNGDVYGGFAGYNFQNDNLVFGGEARFLHVNGSTGILGAEFESIVDLRGRIGYASGNFMIYGAAGYSMVAANDGLTPVDLTGANVGAGVEYNLSQSFFVGADYTARDVEGEAGGQTYEGTANTATLRLGFRF